VGGISRWGNSIRTCLYDSHLQVAHGFIGMLMKRKTKLLIVDDSRIFRNAIQQSLDGQDDIEVIGSVWNGAKAIEFIRLHRPDIVTLDVEMPDMDGLETLQAIQKINATNRQFQPIGVIMLSSYTQRGADTTLKALEMGAFDFIPKPEGKNPMENIEALRRQLVVKIRFFASIRISEGLARPRAETPRVAETRIDVSVSPRAIKAILIGASTGGPRALLDLLPPLCEKVDVPIFIVQHMPPTFTQSLAKSLNSRCRYTVIEGSNDDVAQAQYVYVAPGGKHMLLKGRQQTVRTVVNDGPPENGYKPSVDTLFRSAATVYGGDVAAIILTGMGADGSEGAGVLKRAGAYVIAQDKDSSVVWGMPRSIAESGNADQVLPLDRISHAVVTMIRQSKLR
ncbi:MAG: chemotaxis response regulator protein-glutamate methylesterase, partial [Deltaproteobacteria bacterium]